MVFEIAALLYLCPVACVAFGTERRKRANVNFDTTCSRDCSQTVSRFILVHKIISIFFNIGRDPTSHTLSFA